MTTSPMALALATALIASAALPEAQAGPLLRRMEERKACQEFAGKLSAASGNPQEAQLIYQQGVLKLVEKFGNNPCGDIPAPVAVPATPATPTKPPAASSSNPEQAKACAEFAAKLQAAVASGNRSEAQTIYQMGTQKTTAAFGPNACPAIKAP